MAPWSRDARCDPMRASQPESATLLCAACGDTIGVYEPAVQIVDGAARTTSRAADPSLLHTEANHCYHLACHEAKKTLSEGLY